jgi:hypothetical protein
MYSADYFTSTAEAFHVSLGEQWWCERNCQKSDRLVSVTINQYVSDAPLQYADIPRFSASCRELQLQSHLTPPVEEPVAKYVQRLPLREHCQTLVVGIALHLLYPGIPSGPPPGRIYIDALLRHLDNRNHQMGERRSYSISAQNKDVRKTVAMIGNLQSYTSRVDTLVKLDYCRFSKLGLCRGHSCDTRDEQKACEGFKEHGEVGFVLVVRKKDGLHSRSSGYWV